MRTLVALLAIACTHAHPSDSAFSAATGVSRPAEEDKFHYAPLKPIQGDVEILKGDPEKPGEFYVMRINELPGTMIPVHTHPVDETLTVVKGSWWFAQGDKWDKASLRELRTGDYAFAPRGTSMFAWCPDGGVVQLQGIGPFVIHWKHGVVTLDDKDAAKTFTFKRGDPLIGTRGPGVVKQAYASGDILQYELELADGSHVMENQADLKPQGAR